MDILVIADDFTGACDTGALLRRRGFLTVSVPEPDDAGVFLEGWDALCVDAGSRGMEGEQAYRRIRGLGERFGSPRGLVCKRIDSTLRGNPGREIDGILDALPGGYKAIVVPSCPRAGRICAGGYVLVHGVPLQRSGAADDPRTPVRESKAADIIGKQSVRPAAVLPLDTVLAGSEAVARRIRESPEDVIIADAVTMEDIRTVADGCLLSGVPVVCVDPGDFSLEMAIRRFPRQDQDCQIKGKADGMKIITKGGMIGGREDLQEMLSRIAARDQGRQQEERGWTRQ